jgi:hypothetical protein
MACRKLSKRSQVARHEARLWYAVNEPAEAILDIAECRTDLHQLTELDLAGKLTRRGHHEREDDGGLLVPGSEEGQSLGHLHDVPEVVPDHGETIAQPPVFIGLAVIQGDAFGILANPHHGKTQVGLEALLPKLFRPIKRRPIKCVNQLPTTA